MPSLDFNGKTRKSVGMSTISTATISTKGQLVIPQRIRQALQLRAGERLTLTIEGDDLVLRREQPSRARLVRGDFGRKVLVAPPGAPPMTPGRVKDLLNELP